MIAVLHGQPPSFWPRPGARPRPTLEMLAEERCGEQGYHGNTVQPIGRNYRQARAVASFRQVMRAHMMQSVTLRRWFGRSLNRRHAASSSAGARALGGRVRPSAGPWRDGARGTSRGGSRRV